MKVGVSIVSYNTRDLLSDCLSNLLNQTFKNLNIWVLDNNSSDDSVEYIKKKFKNVRLIESLINTGFAKGQNILLKQINDPFVLILNPDTKIPESTIDTLIKYMQNHSDCGIVSCKIVGFDNTTHSNGGNFPLGMALISWLFNLESLGIKKNFHRSDNNFIESGDVDWVGGTCMLVRQEVFKKIGYFDENYFMYFEDVDLCFRAKKNGFKVAIVSGVKIKHISGASSKDPKLWQWSRELKGLKYFYYKNFGLLPMFYVAMLSYTSVFLRMLAFAAIGRFNYAKTYGKVLINI